MIGCLLLVGGMGLWQDGSGDGQVVWGGVCCNAGTVRDRSDTERAKPQEKALNLPDHLHSNPHSWP